MVGVAEDNERDGSGLAASVEIDTEDTAPGAARCQHRIRTCAIVGVASNVEEKRLKVRTRLELASLWPLEWCCARDFCESVGTKWIRAINLGVVSLAHCHRP